MSYAQYHGKVAEGRASLATLRAERERERQRLERERLAMEERHKATMGALDESCWQEEEDANRLQAEVNAFLPFLGDDIFVLIAAELDARMLGRLGCAAQRFSQPHEHAAPAPDPGVLAPRGQRGRPHRAQRRLRCLPGRHRHGAPLPSLRRRARAAPCCRSACRTPAPWPPRLGC